MSTAAVADVATSPHSHKPLSVRIRTGCDLTGLSHTTIWKLIGNGTLETVSVGRRRLIKYSSLERLVNGGE